MLIDQAIFASGQTDRTAGYQLLGRSPGISAADARELATWGPSHDSLRDSTAAAMSFNFHALPSGAFCASRTVTAGAEYSGRGLQIYTQCLVVAPRTFTLYANNPFNVWRAAEASGALIVYDQVPEQLAQLRLDAVGTAVDRHLLADLATQLGPGGIGQLLESALANPRVAVCGNVDVIQIIAGLINCLPVSCRGEFSFSTGLRESRQRPFRLLAVDDDPVERQRLRLNHGLAVVDAGAKGRTGGDAPTTGWGGYVAAALAGGKTSLLAAELAQPLPALGGAGLNDLGNRLCRKLQSDDTPPRQDAWPMSSARPALAPVGDLLASLEPAQRADGAHARFQAQPPQGATQQAGALAELTAPHQSAEAQELLEHLDDVVYGAINGRADALAELAVLWPTVVASVGADFVDESREQYLRSALSIWTDFLGGSKQGVDRATAALDVVCLLFD